MYTQAAKTLVPTIDCVILAPESGRAGVGVDLTVLADNTGVTVDSALGRADNNGSWCMGINLVPATLSQIVIQF